MSNKLIGAVDFSHHMLTHILFLDFFFFRHRWIQGITDDPPTKVPPTPRKFIWENHEMNLSGTKQCYVPSTTTPKKIEEWVPPINTKS